MDTRVYIEDIHGDEIEVDLLVRDKNDNMVGVYMEGPRAGEEIVLTRDLIEAVQEAYSYWMIAANQEYCQAMDKTVGEYNKEVYDAYARTLEVNYE